MSILNVENLSHDFGDKVIFKNISFRLLKGEKIGLVGANGSGKTTLMNVLTGKLLPDEGIIMWSNNLKKGYLNQHYLLQEGMTIRDTLKAAFSDLYDLEAEIQSLSCELSDGSLSEETMNNKLRKLGNIQEQLYSSDFFQVDSKIASMSEGLGISMLGLDTTVDKLSGGQKTKVMLAKLLLSEPQLLLLDEPTNYLDKDHVEWLADYLCNYKNSYIVISHDTTFLNKITNVIYHLQFANLKRYPGNYEAFLRLKEEEEKVYIAQYHRQQQEIKRLEQFVNSNIVRASTTKRAQSRQKMLDKMDRMEKPKSSIKPSFHFKNCREPGKLIFESNNLEIGYSYPLMKDISLKLTRGEKVALTGCNGIGKTTLLKTIMGLNEKLGGSISYGEYLYPVYYAQEFHYKSDITPLDEVRSDFPSLTQKEIRRALALCGLKEEHIFQSMKSLSGGEQSKVRLCKMMLQPANWLVLDEPTNHLDAPAKEALKESLKLFKGTVLLVCHESLFYEDWITDQWNMESMLVVRNS
jgi:ATPase subunit of ABC transporter with duplicated ATPase domains